MTVFRLGFSVFCNASTFPFPTARRWLILSKSNDFILSTILDFFVVRNLKLIEYLFAQVGRHLPLINYNREQYLSIQYCSKSFFSIAHNISQTNTTVLPHSSIDIKSILSVYTDDVQQTLSSLCKVHSPVNVTVQQQQKKALFWSFKT